ncbi:hypothetical protein EI94DRAFT_1809253 [Lactarius quietus]|nr:hypothetical protein EI94DRAFT_1809253 [Lactarius quietus]
MYRWTTHAHAALTILMTYTRDALGITPESYMTVAVFDEVKNRVVDTGEMSWLSISSVDIFSLPLPFFPVERGWKQTAVQLRNTIAQSKENVDVCSKVHVEHEHAVVELDVIGW